MLWFFDDSFFLPIFQLMMIVVSIFTVAIDRVTTMMNLRSLILKPQYIYVYRDSRWIKVTSDRLKPGDIASVKPSSNIKEPSSKGDANQEIFELRKTIPFG